MLLLWVEARREDGSFRVICILGLVWHGPAQHKHRAFPALGLRCCCILASHGRVNLYDFPLRPYLGHKTRTGRIDCVESTHAYDFVEITEHDNTYSYIPRNGCSCNVHLIMKMKMMEQLLRHRSLTTNR